MAEYVEIGSIVEGQKCEAYTRKETFKGLRTDPIMHKPMIVYELNLNCSVEITEALVLSDTETNFRNNGIYVHGDVGDKLKAEAITLYVDSKRKLKIKVQEGMTSTHGGRLISTTTRTVGKIKYPFQNLCNLFDLKEHTKTQLITE